MSIASAIVLFMVIWALIFLTILPVRIRTQGDLGEIVPGTHAGAPEHHYLKKKAWITTAITLVLWAILTVIIVFDIVTVRDIDFFHRMDPVESEN